MQNFWETRPDPLLLSNQSGYVKIQNKNKILFIQPLKDYDKMISQTSGGKLVTALISGKVKLNKDQLLSFLKNIQTLLSFATGIEVTFPWVSYYDHNGSLLGTVHYQKSVTYEEFHSKVIRTPNSLQQLLEMYSDVDSITKSLINVYLFSNIKSLPVKNKLVRLLIGIEQAINQSKTSKNISYRDVFKSQKKVRKIFKDAMDNLVKDLQELQKKSEENEYLERFKNKASDLFFSIQSRYQDKMKKYLEHCNLHDHEILNGYIQASDEFEKFDDWFDFINEMRNSLVHNDTLIEGLSEETYSQVTDHLRDLLVRIILKRINYTGNYCSFIYDPGGETNVEWVNSSTKPQELGFWSS